MIPRVIYRTWSSASLPAPFEAAWNETARHNPTYQQILVDDATMDRFMHEHYRRHPVFADSVWRAYRRINSVFGTARADLFRYALLFVRGGVYLDVKSAARNISHAVGSADRLVVSHWPSMDVVRLWSAIHLRKWRGEYQQWWLASSPRHPLMAAVLWRVVKNIETHSVNDDPNSCARAHDVLGGSLALYLLPGCRGVDVLWTTGPFAFTRAIDDEILARPSLARSWRMAPPNGNSTFVYDFSGSHRAVVRSYYTRGDPLVVPERSLRGGRVLES